MSFPWETEKARRQREKDEEFARRAVADFHKQYRGAVDRINSATDSEIDEAMADILRRQAARPRGIRPCSRTSRNALDKERG